MSSMFAADGLEGAGWHLVMEADVDLIILDVMLTRLFLTGGSAGPFARSGPTNAWSPFHRLDARHERAQRFRTGRH